MLVTLFLLKGEPLKSVATVPAVPTERQRILSEKLATLPPVNPEQQTEPYFGHDETGDWVRVKYVAPEFRVGNYDQELQRQGWKLERFFVHEAQFEYAQPGWTLFVKEDEETVIVLTRK